MRWFQLSLVLFLFLAACVSSPPVVSPQDAVDTAVAQTVAAWTPTPVALPPTDTPIPTDTEVPTDTVSPPTEATVFTFPAGAECVPQVNEIETARVNRIIDGDTIEVEMDGQIFRVRYIGMDTPESTTEMEAFGPEASARNAELVADKTVHMVKDVSETDRFGRFLRYVFVDDIFVNLQLVIDGFATAATFPPDVASSETFVEAERMAREAGAGLWSATAIPEATNTSLPTNTSIPLPTSTTAPVVQPTTPPQQENCDPSYPDVCIPPPPPDLDCGDISFRRFRVVGSDPHRFDGDNDGIGCES